MKKTFWLSVLLLVTMLIVPTACKAPAEFELMSLNITPPEVTAGDPVGVTAGVKNVGGSEGVYTAMLNLDGVEVETEDVTLAPGTTEMITFSLVKEEAGTYVVAVGELSRELVVRKEIVLAHDDGVLTAGYALFELSHLTHFCPPSSSFKLDKIRIFCCVWPEPPTYEGRELSVKVWDKKTGAVLLAETFPWTVVRPRRWTDLDITNMAVNDDFYVEITTYSNHEGCLNIDFDSSTPNEHSYMSRNGKIVRWQPWTWEGVKYTQENVNWMIRVVGTIMVPEE